MKTNDAKKIIYNYFKGKISAAYPDVFPLTENAAKNIFWARVKQELPVKPYIMLTDTDVSKLYKRFESYVKDGSVCTRTEKRLLVTFGVYTQAVQNNLAQAEQLAIELIEFIENLFSNDDNTFLTLGKLDLVVNEMQISAIRDLSTFSSTNHEFRKEIDVAFEYEDITQTETQSAQGLEIGIKAGNTDNYIKLEVTNEYL